MESLPAYDKWLAMEPEYRERCEDCGLELTEEEVNEYRETPLTDYVSVLCWDCWCIRELRKEEA